MKSDIRKVLREYWDDQPDKWGVRNGCSCSYR